MSRRKLNQTGEGQPKPASIRLKELPADTQSSVLQILETHTYADAQPLVAERVGFECTVNVLFKFRQWHQLQQELEHDADLLEQVEAHLKKRKGDWSPERIQKSALSFLMMQSLSKGDVKSFSSAARLWLRREQLELNGKKLALEEAKYDKLHQRKLDMAFAALQCAFGRNPEAMRLFQQFRDLVLDECDEEYPPSYVHENSTTPANGTP